MRILYTISYYLPHVSGLTAGLVPFVNHFLQRGDDVEILAARHDRAFPARDHDGRLTITRVPVALRLRKGLLMPTHMWESWKAAGRADIVHIIAPQFDAGPTALAARLRGRPVVMSYVCSFSSPGVIGWFTAAAARLSHLIAGLAANTIVALSEDYARQSGFCRLFRRKLTYIDLPAPEYPDQAEPYRPPSPPYRIGFVGRIAAEKNIGLLLDAIPHLRRALGAPFTLELVGPDEPPGAPNAQALAKRIADDRSPELVRRGLLRGEALAEFYRSIDVHVLPSNNRIEAFGLVQVEAMLRGAPCVATDRPGMRQPVLRTGFGRLFAPDDPIALADAVARVLKDGPPTIPSPEAVHREFEPRNAFKGMETVYDQALGR